MVRGLSAGTSVVEIAALILPERQDSYKLVGLGMLQRERLPDQGIFSRATPAFSGELCWWRTLRIF